MPIGNLVHEWNEDVEARLERARELAEALDHELLSLRDNPSRLKEGNQYDDREADPENQ